MIEFYRKHKEVILYIIFGVLTTFVGWAVYFGTLSLLKLAFGLAADVTTGGLYFALYTVAQVLHWIAAVLFAFFTNRKWVFTDADKNVSVFRQLVIFASGRLATFGADFLVTYFGTMALVALIPAWNSVAFMGVDWNLNEIGAKLAAAVIVLVSNYFFSKLFVFKKKKDSEEG